MTRSGLGYLLPWTVPKPWIRTFYQLTQVGAQSVMPKYSYFYFTHLASQIKNFCCVPANYCTVGNITLVTISDDAFPFDYDDINQFNLCLSPQTVKDNLAAITDKLVQEEYLSIVLSKLREVRDGREKTAAVTLDLSFALSLDVVSVSFRLTWPPPPSLRARLNS